MIRYTTPRSFFAESWRVLPGVQNGHDHSAQHIHLAGDSATEYFNIGAGSPVTNSRSQESTLLHGASWDYGDSTGTATEPPAPYHHCTPRNKTAAKSWLVFQAQLISS